jgi:hypothetical protein
VAQREPAEVGIDAHLRRAQGRLDDAEVLLGAVEQFVRGREQIARAAELLDAIDTAVEDAEQLWRHVTEMDAEGEALMREATTVIRDAVKSSDVTDAVAPALNAAEADLDQAVVDLERATKSSAHRCVSERIERARARAASVRKRLE